MPGIRSFLGDAVTHRLPRDFLAEFVSGAITEQSMLLLRASVHSQRRALLLAVMSRSSSHPEAAELRMEQAWGLLTALDELAPDVVESLLMHPSTGVWLVRTLRALLGSGDLQEAHYLRCVAAAAAIRAGHPCRLLVPVIHGTVSLPTVGHARVPARSANDFAELRVEPGETSLHFGNDIEPIQISVGTASPGFLPARHHRASACGIDLRVEIDDHSPYREFANPDKPDPLSTAEWDDWNDLFDRAWNVLTQRHRGYAEELSAGLVAVAPVRGKQGFTGSSSNPAFGAVALSPKESGAALAEVLIHELQHSKLNAVLELVPLRQEHAERWWYAPWRADPRPLVGLLHGIYAFVSVVEFWRDQRHHAADASTSPEGDFAFAYRRLQVRTAVDALASASELTEAGAQLVAAVSDRLAACERDAVSAELTETVALIEKDHWLTWRLRHVQPDDAYIRQLADAWRGNERAPAARTKGLIRPFHRKQSSTARNALLKAAATDPALYSRLTTTADASDLAFVSGDYETARSGYLNRVRLARTDTHAWAGLALTAPTSAKGVLRTSPETVVDLYDCLLGHPDPIELAAWLDRAGQT
nr:HEXXH motif domain-containing protein [Kibdelosporangium sp. MJ126-NF4]CEL17038.1 Transcriptional regulator [Kibdelosporangium sp. MJ126-NF4]CTQ91732.1 Transcriptional regulator [Kibdelosporangium sp. MJ126-NF4]